MTMMTEMTIVSTYSLHVAVKWRLLSFPSFPSFVCRSSHNIGNLSEQNRKKTKMKQKKNTFCNKIIKKEKLIGVLK